MAFNADDADASGDDPAWYVKVYRSTDMEFWNRNEHALLGQRYVRDALARLVPGLPSAQPGDLGVADAFLDECVPDAFDNIPRCEFTSQLCVADVTTLCFGTRRSVR